MTTEPIARAALGTPRAPGAIAAIHVFGDISAVFQGLGVETVSVGAVALRDICGIDHAVVAVLDERTAILTPHGGPTVVSAIMRALEGSGVQIDIDDPRVLYPEAEDEVEALALHTLARAASPRAAALLLDQARRWREWEGDETDEMRRVSAQLDHLVTPPTVVAAGRPNIGKSTLLNALAGRTVSVVADEPGVTRDHVGALLELDGVTVRWIDAPGLRSPENETEARAIELVKEIIAGADLVVLCGDSSSLALTPAELGVDSARCLTLGLRDDLGELARADLCVSVSAGTGLTGLAEAIRGRLVPDSALEWAGPWWFDDRLGRR